MYIGLSPIQRYVVPTTSDVSPEIHVGLSKALRSRSPRLLDQAVVSSAQTQDTDINQDTRVADTHLHIMACADGKFANFTERGADCRQWT